jgi:hypothetical protein
MELNGKIPREVSMTAPTKESDILQQSKIS